MLTNRDISNDYRNYKFYLLPSDFISSFSYWVYYQGSKMEMDFSKSIKAYSNHVELFFKNKEVPEEFDMDRIQLLVKEDVFGSIPEVLKLNKNNDKDFIDLGALERNVKYMIARDQITQP